MDEYNRGNLDAYIELLITGIRDICLPNASAYNKSQISYVQKEAKENGFRTLLVTFRRTVPGGRRFVSYQWIVYRFGKRAAAERLRQRLQKTPKDSSDQKMIGRLLGYSPKAIASFINKLPKTKARQGGCNGKERNQRC
jgi:hypothetical protein